LAAAAKQRLMQKAEDPKTAAYFTRTNGKLFLIKIITRDKTMRKYSIFLQEIIYTKISF
jgi:hypothetical protein